MTTLQILPDRHAGPTDKSRERPLPAADDMDAALLAAFGMATRHARETALKAGVPVAIVVDGSVAWLHPDGSVHADRVPVHGTPKSPATRSE